MQIIRHASFTATPWKNGGGITREAIRVPASGEPFRWRVSVAQIDQSGPFSDFAGYNRTMVLLRGSGAALKFASGDERVLRDVGDVAQFDGALATHCELENGPCVDLNLMVAKSLRGVQTRVQRLREPLTLSAARGRSTLIFPIDTTITLQIEGGQTAVLEAWDLAVISHSNGAAGIVASPRASAQALVFLAIVPD